MTKKPSIIEQLFALFISPILILFIMTIVLLAIPFCILNELIKTIKLEFKE